MVVNGIEIKVGQIWLRRNGSKAEIARVWDGDAEYPVLDTMGNRYRKNGSWAKDSSGREDPCDLMTLYKVAPGAEPAPTAIPPTTTTAPDLLDAAADHMRDRAATYDKPEGERSMAQTVAVFNQFHGTALTETQGWHFMQILKDVRLFANPANPHRDSVEDGVAYSALKGEAILKGGV